MKDKEYLKWLRDRLINVYYEDNNVDFIQKLNGIINNYPEDKVSAPAFKIKEKLFKDIKFGDKFLTANGTVAIFLHTVDTACCGRYRFGSSIETFTTDEEGNVSDSPGLNIVSKYNEPLDKSGNPDKDDNLEEIAIKSYKGGMPINEWIDAFTAGYCKSIEKEENETNN